MLTIKTAKKVSLWTARSFLNPHVGFRHTPTCVHNTELAPHCCTTLRFLWHSDKAKNKKKKNKKNPLDNRTIQQKEEKHIQQAVFWMQENASKLNICYVENASLVGCSPRYLPPSVGQLMKSSPTRIHCLTRADQLSDAALVHQIRLAERLNPGVAVLALDLSNAMELKGSALIRVREAMAGAANITEGRKMLVTGLPNAGKSSLILPLTRERTLEVRKKKEHHLPKVGVIAGRTMGIKSHSFKTESKGESIALVDSPGLRPRLERLSPDDIALLIAANALEPFRGHQDIVPTERILEKLLSALNRHYRLSQEPLDGKDTAMEIDNKSVPIYAQVLGLPGPVEDVAVFSHALLNKFERMPPAMELLRWFQTGAFGGLIFDPNLRLSQAQQLESSKHLKVNRGAAVVCLNEAAKELVEVGTGRLSVAAFNLRNPKACGTSCTEKKNTTNGNEPSKTTKHNNESSNIKVQEGQNLNDRGDKPESRVQNEKDTTIVETIMFPEHRQTLECMQCAGFIKQGAEENFCGTRLDRVLNWPVHDILCFYSRMAEAFGSHKSKYKGYLFRDSLACTLVAKHKLRTRRQAYKKFKVLKNYPVPNSERPKRFRSDQPIPQVHQCSRLKNSCMGDAEAATASMPSLAKRRANKQKHRKG